MTELELAKFRTKLDNLAKASNVDILGNSNMAPITNLCFNAMVEAVKEIKSVAENYDIRKSIEMYLDIEALKLGIKRIEEQKALLEVQINCRGIGSLPEKTLFSHNKLEFRTTETLNFNPETETKTTLRAEKAGTNFNLGMGSVLNTDLNVQNLTNLEVVKTKEAGRLKETDMELRARLFEYISKLSSRDTKSFYTDLLKAHEEIREAKIVRTPRGINSMDIIIRPLNQEISEDTLKKIVAKQVGDFLPFETDTKIHKAKKTEIEIIIKLNTDTINKEDIEEKVKHYFVSLHLGATFNIADLYSSLGKELNILAPTENKSAGIYEFWSVNVKFI